MKRPAVAWRLQLPAVQVFRAPRNGRNRTMATRLNRGFYGQHTVLADVKVFADWRAPLLNCEWVVYAKRPFAGPQAVLDHLSRYTHPGGQMTRRDTSALPCGYDGFHWTPNDGNRSRSVELHGNRRSIEP